MPQSFVRNRFYEVIHNARQNQHGKLAAFLNDTASVGTVWAGGTILPPRGRHTFLDVGVHNQSTSQQTKYFEEAGVAGGSVRLWDTKQSTDLGMLLRVVLEVQPTILVMGIDNHWPRDRPIQGGSYCALAQQLDRELKRQGFVVKVVLRTNGVVSEVPRGAVPKCYACDNVLVYDVWSISQMVRQTVEMDWQFFVDDFHYKPWVYDKLNLALIRLLGYEVDDETFPFQIATIRFPNVTEGACVFNISTCADCRALWRDDAWYSRYNFGCPSCHVAYMKPTRP